MSASVWIVGAGLAAAPLVVVGLLLARRGAPVLADNDHALTAAETLPGFAPVEALVGDDRRATLIVGRHARVALVTARGRRLAVREVRWQDVRAVAGGLRVEAGEPVFVAGIDVLDVRRAGGAEMRRAEPLAAQSGAVR